MKVERQDKGVEIFLTWDEANEMCSIMKLGASWEYDLATAISLELEEIFTKEGAWH